MMRCVVCDDWSEHSLECDNCDSIVCDDDAIFDDVAGMVFCSEECQDADT